MKNNNYKIEIEINCTQDEDMHDVDAFEYALDEAVRIIKEGYTLGRDANEDEDYSFAVKRTKINNSFT
jgi:hypothetical protein